jgi:hypothetical protein
MSKLVEKFITHSVNTTEHLAQAGLRGHPVPALGDTLDFDSALSGPEVTSTNAAPSGLPRANLFGRPVGEVFYRICMTASTSTTAKSPIKENGHSDCPGRVLD